jgi:geranylgeranyl diphosphate synthase type II
MITNVNDYQVYIESLLDEYEVPGHPKNLYEPIRYFLKIGGKRMRPVLALMSAELFTEDYKVAKNVALAVELFHNFTLIHDDIMDAAPLRRGKETVHTKWNSNIGILSGDTLMIAAYEQLTFYPPAILAQLLPLFNRTAKEVCEGQQMDMDFESESIVEIDDYIKMIAYKTAVLLGCSLKMGAIVGGASENDAQDLYEFGLNLGIAFQIQDDILDVYADQNKFGKQVGGDIIANKKTYLLLRAYQDAHSEQLARLNAFITATDSVAKVHGVKLIYNELSIREKATEQMNAYHTIALQNLEHLGVSEEKKAPLRALAEFLLGREH